MSNIFFKPDYVLKAEAFRTALAMAVGVFIYKFFHLPYGPWVATTIAIIYLAGAAHSFITQRINKKIIGAFLGVIFGIMSLGLFGYYNYHWLYILTPAAFFLAFYTYFMSKMNYAYLTFFITIYMFLTYNITVPENIDVDLFNAGIGRIYCAILGVGILGIIEFFIFSRTTMPKKTTVPMIDHLISQSRHALGKIIFCYAEKKELADDYWLKVSVLSNELSEIEQLVRAAVFEMNFIPEYEQYYNKIIKSTVEMIFSVRNLAYICNHKDTQKVIMTDGLKEIYHKLEEFTDNRKNDILLSRYFAAKYLETRKLIKKNSAEYLFILSLYKALKRIETIEEYLKLIAQETE